VLVGATSGTTYGIALILLGVIALIGLAAAAMLPSAPQPQLKDAARRAMA
jgi:hypothetical protein